MHIYREPKDDEVDLKAGDPTNWVWKTWYLPRPCFCANAWF